MRWEFVLTVLERLAERYKDREGLFGIEVLNEPISFKCLYDCAKQEKWLRTKTRRRVPIMYLQDF